MKRTAFLLLVPLVASPVTAQQTYRHPLGYSFQYPTGWQVVDTEQGLMVSPPDAARDANGQPLELLLLASQDAQGITRLDDPRVVALFEQNFPGMRAAGAPQALTSGLGPAALLTLEGDMGGPTLRQRIYITLHNGQALYLIHLAKSEFFEARSSAAKSIFTSFAFEQPKGDAQLFGTWRRERVEGSNSSSGYVGSTTIEIVTFKPDGTLEYSTSSAVSGSSGGVSIQGGGNPNVTHGRYTAAGGRLMVTIGGGQESYGYSLFIHEGAPALRVDAPGESKPRYYTRVR